ncbi:hypothetical protein A1O3_04463 [Capronia epimyces CBS 606.96]|uniref:PHD-type domain-containing protein n=1 Tax=Capronia epimyces CBS 606.96 TaxID=1182542 RepID=W9Y4S4_9EURO|nr:uncharacterized protein A1O3_04463 [Capronia epimyces CBS 606.96]EXJ87503.1 hypothetical protein A1O3_04463 [Capronia epimyces CBS 606.96]
MSANQRPVMGPPETPSRVMQQSPGLFPSLQLSPDMLYAHQFSGPATVPVYSDQRLFWDPSNVGFEAQSLPQQYPDPFQFSPSGLSSSFASSSTVVPSFAPQVTLLEEQPYDLPVMRPLAGYSHANGSTFPAPFTTSPRLPAPQAENPSMFLSSPARRFGATDYYSNMFAHNPALERPAYAHQIEESRREQETKRLRKGDMKQPSITRSVMEALRRPVSPRRDNRPGLKRSLTHTGVRGERTLNLQTQNIVGSRNSPITLDQNRPNRPGRSSPLKTNPDPISRTLSTSRNSNTKRGSLSLAIDEDGVAKMILTENSRDIDMGGISGSDAGSFDETDLHILHSQDNSFAFPEDGDPSVQAHVGLSRHYSHAKTNSHSTMASANSATQSPYNGSVSSFSNTRGSDGHQGPRRKRPLLGPSIETDTLAEDGPFGNAQFALRAIIQDRSRSNSSQGDGTNQVHLHSSPPLQQSQYAMYNASPTTITDPDLATPSTDRESLTSNMSMRCVCNSSVLDGSVPMVQCDSCTKWLHSTCVGIDNRRILEPYMCIFCIQTPKRSGHAALRPSALPSAASPLAHKSKRHR